MKIDLLNYDLGEYNLISNIPSQYYFNISVTKNNSNISVEVPLRDFI